MQEEKNDNKTTEPDKAPDKNSPPQNADYVEQKKAARARKKQNPYKLDTSGKTVEQLTELYNEMVATATDLKKELKHIDVRKDVFPTPEQGRRACERLHSLILKTREQLSSPKKEKATVKKSATKKSAKKSASKKSGGKRTSFTEDMKITWKGKDNPFREGSGRWKRTEIVRTSSGKTVKTFLASKGRRGTLSYCVRNGLCAVG